jgi:outer membrane protein TolC
MKRLFSIVCVALICLPASGQKPVTGALTEPGGTFAELTRPFRGKEVAPINLSNSGRMDALMRGGKLYLSLQDVISLALENNLDIEVQRYGARLAETDLMRARAGGFLRGVQTNLSGGGGGGGGAGTGGGGGGAGLVTGFTSAADLGGGSGTLSGGSGIPSLDPVLQSSLSWGHFTQPTTNSFITGTSAVVATNKNYNLSISQGFLSGATATLGLNNFSSFSSSLRNDFNPYTSSNLNLTVNQPLLRGFGLALNSRNIRIAKNNLQISDLVFRRQVIQVISDVIGRYWDLVSANEDVNVRRQSLALSQRLYNDIRKQVEIGTLAQIEIIRSEAEVAAREQDLLVAETNVLQLETILKDMLSRTGVASPALADARIIPTDRITIPQTEAVEPMQDLVARALDQRPELAQSRIALDNSKISLKASKNALLPEVDGFVVLRNNALVGEISSLPLVDPISGQFLARNPANINSFFLGGYGTALGQLFRRNFPDYQVGVQLSIPLRNRAAQADVITAQLNLRQQELNQQAVVNQVRVEVQNALIGLQQARARHQAALKNRVLQEQTLDAEQRKYSLGASTIFQVIFAQRDVAQAKANEVVALSSYARAKVSMDRSLGRTLEANNIQIEEASRGSVSTPPSPIPVLEPEGNNGGTANPPAAAGAKP